MRRLVIEELPDIDQEELIKAYKRVFNTEDGKVVLADMQCVHHMLSTSYSENTNEVMLKEGERNVLLRILSIINTDLETLRVERQSTEDYDV